jgi:hypothetical protein
MHRLLDLLVHFASPGLERITLLLDTKFYTQHLVRLQILTFHKGSDMTS